MKIAILADIHSNLYALKAVLADAKSRGADRIVCAGDVVGYGPHPSEVIALLQKEQIPTVMGNYDDAIGYERFICGCDYKDPADMKLAEKSIEFTLKATSAEDKTFLRSLPPEYRIINDGLDIVIVHGSPVRLNEYLYADTPAQTLEEMLNKARADVLVCGHTHIPYHRKLSNGHVVNAGSVGKPKHGNPNALYCILELKGRDVAAVFVEVPYDVERTARMIEQNEVLPNEFAEKLRLGTG
ncbi:metallophosphoesterase family protein [Desulforudis sp. 1088]|uniref:metallophosphoesterase family protein n=1 Tax=unclassified Candidatus Desulforudis TaxID=2635950 RepID=UPI003CE48925